MNYLLWQLADSGFPAGGFAHSGGVEAAMQHGWLRGAASIHAFARHTVLQAARSGLPIVSAAHRDSSELEALDRFSEALLTNPVARRASCAQGRALLATCGRAFPDAPIEPIGACVADRQLAGHYAPLFGAITDALNVPLEDAQRLYLYLAGRGVGSAAVRLGLIGAFEAQTLQTSLAPHIEQAAVRFGDLPVAEAAQPAPVIDLFQSTHDRLYSRLFQS